MWEELQDKRNVAKVEEMQEGGLIEEVDDFEAATA